MDTVLKLSGIDKKFGGVSALRGAGLEVLAGEVHGLVGENGAGKSTLINVATGLFPPSGGELALCGQAIRFHNPREAARAGVLVVHQEAELFAQLSIAENMLLARGLVRGRAGVIRWGATYQEAERLVGEMGEQFDVRRDAGGLPVARRTMAEIAAAVAQQPKVLFLDEPTASLTQKEIHNLFAQIRRLRDAGVGIVYVSHRLEEVLALCDRVTIMRDGATIDTRPVQALTMSHLVAAMVGRELQTDLHPPAPLAPASGERDGVRGDTPPAPTTNPSRLRVEHATAADGSFHDISLEVRSGEIVGIYGFVGAGRSEFAQALFGLKRLSKGNLSIDGLQTRVRTPRQAVAAGLAYLPEDRLVQGIFRAHAIRRNASAAVLPRLSRFTLLSPGKEKRLAADVISGTQVRAASMEQPIGTLSGGNQQKVVFGRWAATTPRVLLLDEPTRGVDVGAKAEIHRLIRDLAAEGAAVVMISSELPEIMAMSDRIVTLSEGRQTGEFNPRVDTQEAVAAAAVPRQGNGKAAPVSQGRMWLARALELRELGLLTFILLLSIVMTVLRPAEFATPANFLDVLANAALPAILAQAAMLIICAGGIDISVGSLVGLTAAIAGLAATSGLPPALCLLAAMISGVFLSICNAGIALIARIHPIIVTLAGLSIYRGLMRVATGGSEIMSLPPAYRALADGRLLGIPKICYYVIFVTLGAHFFLRYSLRGRQVLALGNSESAARLIGLSKSRLTLLVFGLSGALAGLTAVLVSGYYGKVQANTGMGMELQAIAAAVIGGTNILGGRGSAIGTLLGAFLIALLYNSLVLLNASSYWQNIFVGGLILLAVIIDSAVQRLRRAQP